MSKGEWFIPCMNGLDESAGAQNEWTFWGKKCILTTDILIVESNKVLCEEQQHGQSGQA